MINLTYLRDYYYYYLECGGDNNPGSFEKI